MSYTNKDFNSIYIELLDLVKIQLNILVMFQILVSILITYPLKQLMIVLIEWKLNLDLKLELSQ